MKRLTVLCLCLALFIGGVALPSAVFGYAPPDEHGVPVGTGIPGPMLPTSVTDWRGQSFNLHQHVVNWWGYIDTRLIAVSKTYHSGTFSPINGTCYGPGCGSGGCGPNNPDFQLTTKCEGAWPYQTGEWIIYHFGITGVYNPATYDWDGDGTPDAPDPDDDTPLAQVRKGCKNTKTEYDIWSKKIKGNDENAGMPGLLINLAHLNFVLTDKDIAYQDHGRTIQIVRTYNAYSTYGGIFGRGWTFNYGIHLTQEPSGDVIVVRGSGAEDRFVLQGDGTYAPPKAVYDQLTKNSDGTFALWVKRSRLTYAFGTNGVLNSVIDSNGNTVTLSYDLNGLLTTITDASGRTISFSYNVDNKVETILDPLDRQITFSYENGNMHTSTDVAEVTTTFTYDAMNLLTSMTTPNGTTSFAYQDYPFGRRLVSVTDAEGQTTLYAIDAPNQEVMVTDARGNTTRYGYNYDGYTTYITDPLGNKTAFGYDAHGNRTSVIDANGKQAAIYYDSRGNVTAITDPLGDTSTFGYDARDNLTLTTDPLGRVYAYTYDANDNLLQIADPLTNQTDFTYDAQGQLLSLIDARDNTATFAYDPYGNLQSVTDPLGNAATFTYNLIGKRESFTDPLGNTSNFEYDPLGRLIKTIHSDTTAFIIERYCSGISGIIDENGKNTLYDHNAINQRTKVTDPMGHETSYAYDPTGNLAALTDPLGQATAFAYDAVDRLAQLTYPEGTSESYTYDPVGNLVTTVDPNGQAITYQYDDLNRLISVTGLDFSITYTYDVVGNLDTMSDATGTTDYAYDELNRLTQVTYPNGQTIGYTYNEVGDITGIATPFGTVGYTYDIANRLSGITLPNAQEVIYQYDAGGNLLQVDFPNGTAGAYAYDSRNRLDILTNYGLGDAVIAAYAYTLDGVGNRTQVDLIEPLVPSFTPEIVDYTYGLGNILTTADGNSYTHDANGNMTHKTDGINATNYTYDSLNRLTQVADSSQITEYIYNGLGQRVGKIVDGVQTNYLIDPNGILPQVLAEMDENNDLIAFYAYDGSGLVAKVTPANEYYFYHYDGLGSTIAITDSSAQIVNAYAYSPYGLVGSQETIENSFEYVGRFGVMAEGNGLYFMRARYYDPEVGRFVNKDPIGYAGGMNLFTYCQNDPINFIDPWGLWDLTYGGSFLLMDFSAQLYDSEKGWFPSTETDFGFSTTLWGGGFQVSFDTGVPPSTCEEDSLTVSFALASKYLGVSYDPELTHASINFGIGMGLPITFSKSVGKFTFSELTEVDNKTKSAELERWKRHIKKYQK